MVVRSSSYQHVVQYGGHKSWEQSKKSHSMLQFCISCWMATKTAEKLWRRSLFFNCHPPTFQLVFSIHCAVTLTMQWCHGPHWRHKQVVTSWRYGGEDFRGMYDVTVLCSSTKLLPIGWGSHFPTKAATWPWPWHARSQIMQSCQRAS